MRAIHLARTTAYFRKKIRALLLFSKLLRTSWFLIVKLSAQVFVFLLSSGYLRETWKNFPQHGTREREYLLSQVYLLRKQKFRFLLRTSAKLISFPRTIINRISLHNHFTFIFKEKVFLFNFFKRI